MTDDLITRLRSWPEPRMEILRNLLDEAVERIEALEAERDEAQRHWRVSLEAARSIQSQRDARDAVIAEALAVEVREGHAYEALTQVVAILSRVPQGAAEPWTDPKPARALGSGRMQGMRGEAALARLYPDLWTLDPRTREQYDAETVATLSSSVKPVTGEASRAHH